MKNITIKLGIFGIVISHVEGDIGGAAITSEMKAEDTAENAIFNFGIDALESMILGHFSSGIDVTSKAYLAGIQTACDALGNNAEDEPDVEDLWDSLKKSDVISINDRAFSKYDVTCKGIWTDMWEFSEIEIDNAVYVGDNTWEIEPKGFGGKHIIKCYKAI